MHLLRRALQGELTELVELPNERKVQVDAVKRAEKLKKRRHERAQRLEDEKQATVDKLLNKSTTKRKRKEEVVQKVANEELTTKFIYIDSEKNDHVLLIVPEDFEIANETSLETRPGNCSCGKQSRYSHPELEIRVCSLECYRRA